MAGLLFLPAIVKSQQYYTVSGTVGDSVSGNSLTGATVFDNASGKGVISGPKGHYTIGLEKGQHELVCSYLGYKAKQMIIVLQDNRKIDFNLSPTAIETEQVVITSDNPADHLESTKTGHIQLTGKEIAQLPALMGEPDPIMTIHYTPGVQSASEGNSGFYVRGGNVDQNLILLDNATVFNPAHVLGFFSVFNTDVINDVDLIKSGIPAKYGGRLSSVLLVNTRDGNFDKFSFGTNVGLISSKITAEGPLHKDKISFIGSFRRTYIDELLKPLVRPFTSGKSSFYNDSRYHFYDLNGKISWVVNRKNRISASYYSGIDYFSLMNDQLNYNNLISWGNNLVSLSWYYAINSDTYLNSSFHFSDYSFNFDAGQNEVTVNLFSSVRKWNVTTEFGKKNFRMGFDGHFNFFVPNKLLLDINEISLNYSSNQKLQSTEASVYASYKFDFGNRFRLYAGARYTNYLHLGPYTFYRETAPGVYNDSVYYNNLHIVKPYNSFEPRIAARFLINDVSSLKATYTRNYQYIHIASASSVALPSDIWIPSTMNVKPQYADHFSIGYYRNLMQDRITGSVDAYYRQLYNQIELLYGIGTGFQEKSFEKSITTGKGNSMGIELMIEKKTGKTTGWIGYTLSGTNREFAEINEGKIYPAKYDRRHDINLVVVYHLNDRWNLSSAFIYASGNAMSLPYQKYVIDGKILNYYGKTNSFRMPAYHRLDIAATYSFLVAQKYESSLNFSVFNVYNRANPFFIYFEISGDVFQYDLKVHARQISLFPVIPSVSWSIKF